MKIDFVVTWVDGEDSNWILQKKKYQEIESKTESTGNSVNRYRDWGLLKFWFRCVEKNAPWVNKIFFVTCGQIPEWLDTNNPKLVCVNHADFMPVDALPTYNSNAIELALPYLEELSEHFVLFNDDMFLLSETNPEDFFVDGYPRDEALLDTISSVNYKDVFPHTMLNNTAIINKYFDKKEVLKKNKPLFLYSGYGKAEIIRNLMLWKFKYFSGFRDLHLPSSHLKSTFIEVEEKETQIYRNTIYSRFRTENNITHFLIKNWRICKGEFLPRNTNWGIHLEIGEDKNIVEYIEDAKYKAVCINDSNENLDYEKEKNKLIKAFEKKYAQKSSFERM